LYRLETREQIVAAGLEEYFFQPKGVTVVEWVERWLGAEMTLAGAVKFRHVVLKVIGPTEREIEYEDPGN
jgi:tRNA A37 threonylcarbamoyladenosine biosynthesis protein TsaE